MGEVGGEGGVQTEVLGGLGEGGGEEGGGGVGLGGAQGQIGGVIQL